MCVIAIASPLPSPIKRAEPHSLPRTPPSMTLTLRLPPIARRPQRGLRRWLHHLLLAGAEWRAARARRHPAGRLGPVLPAGQHREPASRGICRLSGHQGCDSHRRALRAPVGPGRESEGERVRCQCDVPAVPRTYRAYRNFVCALPPVESNGRLQSLSFGSGAEGSRRSRSTSTDFGLSLLLMSN